MITDRAGLVDSLSVACELEQGLSLQYLFAAFSLRKETNEGLGNGEQLIATRRWAANIFFVAAQEMLHLAQASNLLLAIGGAPHLGRPNFPQPPGTYPPDLGWELTAFSSATLDRFIAYESPEPDPSASGGPAVGSRLTHETIGQMYADIEHAFATLDLPASDLFIGRPDDQIPGALVNFPQLVEVTDRASAKRAITLIVDQGEGTRRDQLDSHYGIFRTIQADLKQVSANGFDPARPVVDNPVAQMHSDMDNGDGPTTPGQIVNVITDPTTRAVEDVFTAAYDILLLALFRFFAGGSKDSAAPVVKRVTLDLMMTVVRPLGELLTRLPMGPEYGSLTAGPSFEVFPGIELLPHAAAARTLIAERLGSAADSAALLSRDGDLSTDHQTVMRSVAASLAAMAASMHNA